MHLIMTTLQTIPLVICCVSYFSSLQASYPGSISEPSKTQHSSSSSISSLHICPSTLQNSFHIRWQLHPFFPVHPKHAVSILPIQLMFCRYFCTDLLNLLASGCVLLLQQFCKTPSSIPSARLCQSCTTFGVFVLQPTPLLLPADMHCPTPTSLQTSSSVSIVHEFLLFSCVPVLSFCFCVLSFVFSHLCLNTKSDSELYSDTVCTKWRHPTGPATCFVRSFAMRYDCVHAFEEVHRQYSSERERLSVCVYMHARHPCVRAHMAITVAVCMLVCTLHKSEWRNIDLSVSCVFMLVCIHFNHLSHCVLFCLLFCSICSVSVSLVNACVFACICVFRVLQLSAAH